MTTYGRSTSVGDREQIRIALVSGFRVEGPIAHRPGNTHGGMHR
jgi:hypothetical protein